MSTEKLKIHILSIMALNETSFPKNNCNYAVINCAERKNRILSAYPPSLLLQLTFADTVRETDPRGFSAEHGEKIKSFLKTLPDTVSDLFIFCDAGESRSTAIAAAILLATGRSDGAVWNNPFYHPNTLVFSRLCQAFGIDLSNETIEGKRKQSEDAFKNAMKNGTVYKRWEVI